jgi:hypothetical protein
MPRLVRAWAKLLYQGHFRAAAGMTCDLFDNLAVCEHDPKMRSIPALTEFADKRAPRIREVLMVMLGDIDGKELRRWIELYHSDLPAFKSRALRFVHGVHERRWQNDIRRMAESADE